MNDKFDDFMNGKANKQDVENYVQNNLTESQRSKIADVLQDKEKLSKILSNPQVQELIKKFKRE